MSEPPFEIAQASPDAPHFEVKMNDPWEPIRSRFDPTSDPRLVSDPERHPPFVLEVAPG
jgi:hypothetical protein